MCGAAPLTHEVVQKLFELLPDAHIGQAYGNYKLVFFILIVSGLTTLLLLLRLDRNWHCGHHVAYQPKTWSIWKWVMVLLHLIRNTEGGWRDIGAGQLMPGIVAKVVKSDGSLAGFNEPGELFVKTPSVAMGYANNAEA
jgi:4-coumarate--CoA ligase